MNLPVNRYSQDPLRKDAQQGIGAMLKTKAMFKPTFFKIYKTSISSLTPSCNLMEKNSGLSLMMAPK